MKYDENPKILPGNCIHGNVKMECAACKRSVEMFEKLNRQIKEQDVEGRK